MLTPEMLRKWTRVIGEELLGEEPEFPEKADWREVYSKILGNLPPGEAEPHEQYMTRVKASLRYALILYSPSPQWRDFLCAGDERPVSLTAFWGRVWYYLIQKKPTGFIAFWRNQAHALLWEDEGRSWATHLWEAHARAAELWRDEVMRGIRDIGGTADYVPNPDDPKTTL